MDRWRHDHTFGQDIVRPGERRTMIVIAITALMMIIEISAGLAFGSMALLADGLHMASHATALALAAFAYIYARRHASDQRFTFGTRVEKRPDPDRRVKVTVRDGNGQVVFTDQALELASASTRRTLDLFADLSLIHI